MYISFGSALKFKASRFSNSGSVVVIGWLDVTVGGGPFAARFMDTVRLGPGGELSFLYETLSSAASMIDKSLSVQMWNVSAGTDKTPRQSYETHDMYRANSRPGKSPKGVLQSSARYSEVPSV